MNITKMFALIFENKVIELAENKFPVAKLMQWAECNQNVKVGWFYINKEFRPSNKSDSEFLKEIQDDKISQIKLIRNKKNTEPIAEYKAFLIDNDGNKTDQESFFIFYTNRHQTNPASDPSTIISRTLDLGAMPYFTKDLDGNKITVELTSNIAKAIQERISQRNDNNYRLSAILESEITQAKTVEEIEAITAGIKE